MPSVRQSRDETARLRCAQLGPEAPVRQSPDQREGTAYVVLGSVQPPSACRRTNAPLPRPRSLTEHRPAW